MSIRQQVDDALFLAQRGRHLGALTLLLVAVAASSRKRFPKGSTVSVRNPPDQMRDGEAFELFLGGQLYRITTGDIYAPDFGKSPCNLEFKGQEYRIEHILYKFYRCNLIHEGSLPSDIEFVPPPDGEYVPFWFAIGRGDKLLLDYRAIDELAEAIIQAPCNGPEFGIKHYHLKPKPNVDEAAFRTTVINHHDITDGRYNI